MRARRQKSTESPTDIEDPATPTDESPDLEDMEPEPPPLRMYRVTYKDGREKLIAASYVDVNTYQAIFVEIIPPMPFRTMYRRIIARDEWKEIEEVPMPETPESVS